MQLEKLSSTFHALDYDAEMIDQQISRARDRFQQTKDPILSSNTPEQKFRPRILTTYNKHLNRLKTITKDLQPILENDPTLKKSFSSVPMITYRQPPSLKHILTSSQLRINNDLTMGTQPCQQPRCKLYPHINTNDTLTGHMSNAIGSSRESNPSRRICHLRAVPLGHVADNAFR